MISGVTVDVAGRGARLRMSTRAMMAIEDRFGCGISDVMARMEAGFRLSDLVHVLAECMADGAGAELGEAQRLVDAAGLERAGAILGDVAAAAFPEATADDAKNGTRAAPVE